jgi:hypothetical protein
MSCRRLSVGLLVCCLALAACRNSAVRPQPTQPLPSVAATATAVATATPAPARTATPKVAPTATSLPAAEIMLCAFSHPPPRYHVWVMRADGAGQRLLAPEAFGTRAFSWAPDGQQIVFAAYHDNSNALFIVDLDAVNGAPRRLTDAPTAVDDDPFWSPDGEWIVFSRAYVYDSSIVDIYAIRPDGSGTRQLTTSGSAGRLAGWLPDGRVAVLQPDPSGSGVWVSLSVDDPGAEPAPLDGFEAPDIATSPNGVWTLFERGDDIFRMHPDGSAVRDLTDRAGEDTRPSWAPDGAHIAFASTVTAVDATLQGLDRLGEPLPITLRFGDATQQGRVGPYCVTTSSSAMGTDALGVHFPAEPLSAPAETPLVFKPWLNDANGLTIVAYDYVDAVQTGAIAHGVFFSPCAPLGATQATCGVATAHSFTPDLRLPLGQYIIVVSLTWQRGAEQGYSEQGFNIMVEAP